MRPKKQILCVDSDDMALNVHTCLLETRGYRVTQAHSAAEAEALFRAISFDLVVVAFLLDDSPGDQLARTLKEIQREIPILLISSRTRRIEALFWADAFLGKGFNSPVELLERVRILIARRRGPKKLARPVAAVIPEPAPVALECAG